MPEKKKNLEKSNQPEEEKKANSLRVTEATYHGPIPHSSELQRYEKVLPGAADRIISMAEDERKDRNRNTRLEIRLHYGSLMFAQAMFALICLGAVSGGIYLVTQGESLTGYASIFAGLGTIAGGFFLAQKGKDKKDDK